jgi:AcrR family transcriptional regulator
LFAAQGYDATSTEEISEKAGVSARTFFRYFPTKEAVLFSRKDLWFASLAKTYHSQPASLNDLEAVRSALIELAPGLARRREMLRLYEQSVATSLTLRGLRLDHQEHDSKDLAAAIAARRGLKSPDETCTLLGLIGVMAHRRGLDTWLAGPDDLKLVDVIDEKFRLLALPFTSATDRPVNRTVILKEQPSRVVNTTPIEAKEPLQAAKRGRPRPAVPADGPNQDEMDDAQRLIALEQLRALNRQVRSASRREGLAGVSRLLRRTRSMKLFHDRPPTK